MSLEKEEIRPRFIPSKRFTLALLISFALFTQYAQRISLSISIVCMVNKTKSDIALKMNLTSIGKQKNSAMIINKYGSQFLHEKQFFLNEFQQQILLGAHWFGSTVSIIPGSWLSMKIGAKRVFLFSLLLSSSASLLMGVIYFLNRTSFILAVFLRILVGFGHGPLFPATYRVWSLWAVPVERSTLTSIGFCSSNLGTAMTMLFGGLLCRYVVSGWVYIFSFTGIFGFIWLPLWIWLVTDSPLSHSTISEQEQNYLCKHIGINSKNDEKKSISFLSLPWRKIVRSKPIIGLFFSQFLNIFGLFFFYTNIGKLLTEVHGVSPEHAGYILAVGFLLMPIACLSTGIIADRLVRSEKMTPTNVRKLFNSLTSFIPALCMIVLCFCDRQRQILGSITILIVLSSSAIAYGSGYVVNFADIVPAYSSMIFAISSTISTVGLLGSSFIAGMVIKQPILEHWRTLFILFAVTYTIAGVVFLVFGSAVPRKWATYKSNERKLDEEDQPLTILPSPKTTNLITIQSIYSPE